MAADVVRIRRGLKESLPTLYEGTLGYCKDTKELWIGTEEGNVLLASNVTLNGLVGDVQILENTKLTATPVAAQQYLAAGASTSALVEAFNSLVAAMMTSGVMNRS